MADQQPITKTAIKGIHKDLAPIVLDAGDHGWTIKKTKNGFSLLCPCGEHRAYVPLKQGNNGSIITGLKAKIDRCPKNRVIVADHLTTESQNALLSAAVATGDLAVGVRMKNGDTFGVIGKRQVEIITPPRRTSVEAVLVSTLPWLAKKRDRRDKNKTVAYESHAVMEQTWSDGVLSYVCPHCDWGGRDQRNPHSVASHYRKHALEDQRTERQPIDLVEVDHFDTPPRSRSYSPSRRMLALITQQISLAIAAGIDPESEEFADRLLTWLHDRPDLPDPEPSEPISDEEIVTRIRRLVDGGRYSELDSQIRSLQQSLAEQSDRAEKAVARAERVEARLMRLAEMAIED